MSRNSFFPLPTFSVTNSNVKKSKTWRPQHQQELRVPRVAIKVWVFLNVKVVHEYFVENM
jgi:hypothetical protein